MFIVNLKFSYEAPHESYVFLTREEAEAKFDEKATGGDLGMKFDIIAMYEIVPGENYLLTSPIRWQT